MAKGASGCRAATYRRRRRRRRGVNRSRRPPSSRRRGKQSTLSVLAAGCLFSREFVGLFFFFFFSLPSRVRVSHEFVAVVGAIPARRGNPVLHPSRVIHPTVADERIVSSVRFESEIGARQRYTARRVHKPTTRGEGERDVTQDYPRSHVVRTPLIVHAIDTLLRFVLRFTYFRGFGDFVTQFFRFLWSRVVLEKRKDIGRLVLFKTKFVIESIYIYIKYFMS